jgi:hypothetical protein
MSPEYVRPYVKAQKNDDRDEAATRPTMVGGGLDQPYREMNSSGPHVDRFLPEQ